MRVPFSWLREYVDVNVSASELAHRLTLAGTEVGNVLPIGAHWQRVVIGRVDRFEPHPNADHLFVVDVQAGGNTITLVTAAPNLQVGDVVPVVRDGGQLAEGQVLRARDFRGITSEGMLCSGDELGVSPDKEHIYVLEPEAPIGEDLRTFLGDEILDIELTPNRPDCTGIVGIAREASALTGATLRLPQGAPPRGAKSAADCVRVFIDDPDLCPRYTAGYIEGTRPGPSPAWMQRRLYLCGMRPISNLVDITNYVMLELGQPLHAFDADKLADATIHVRRARPGERLTTIDGIDRDLPPGALLISDAGQAVAIAGIMGGLDTEISNATQRVVLESACFDRVSVRRTARALRFATEASKRFDKGLDPELPSVGSYRALALMAELAGGSPAEGLVDVWPTRPERRQISFSAADVAGLIGRHYSDDEIERVLGRLGFELRRDHATYHATVPSWRRDVEGKADIAEEMARVIGYDSIPTLLPSGRLPAATEEPLIRAEETVRTALAAAGLQEVITYSLVDPRAAARLDADSSYPDVPPDEQSIPVSNPMSVEHSRLRTTLLPSLLSTLAANLRYQERVGIFEIARVFLPPLAPLPREERRLAIALAGPREPRTWAAPAAPFDFYDLKATVEAAFRSLHLPAPEVASARGHWLHPSRGARIRLPSGQEVGFMGQVHPRVAERFDVEKVEVYAAELLLEPLLVLAQDQINVRPLPRFPAVARDLAIVIDEEIPYADVTATIREAAGALLDELDLFDLYRGAPIPTDKRSLAYALTFRATDRTLAEEEVGSAIAAIEAELARRFRASIRGAGG